MDRVTAEAEFWVLRAQAGDRQALDFLLRSLQAPLHRYIAELTRDRDAADDILQEVFLRIHRGLVSLREPALLRPWAYRIATRETWRHLRRRSRLPEPLEDAAAPDAGSDPSPSPELLRQLAQGMEQLSPACRAVIVLFYFHDLPLGDVAAALSIPLGTVKSRLAYGLKALRRHV